MNHGDGLNRESLNMAEKEVGTICWDKNMDGLVFFDVRLSRTQDKIKTGFSKFNLAEEQ